MGTLRITSGRYKNRRLSVPKKGTRPTAERVREAIFSALAGRVDDAHVLDAFAGSGALGIEALSRGAASAVFVERGKAAAAQLQKNIAQLNPTPDAEVVVADTHRYLGGHSRAPTRRFDVVFVDPPYAYALDALFPRIFAVVAPGGVVVLERDKRSAFVAPAGSTVTFDREYGDTRIVMLTLTEAVAAAKPDDGAAVSLPTLTPDDRRRSETMTDAKTARSAIYAGSFDPLTNGHIDILKRGLKSFDRIVLAIANNPNKSHTFDIEQRIAMAHAATADLDGVEVDTFDGLLVNFATESGIGVLLRGLRAVSDFEYEFQLATMNRNLAHDVETMFMMTSEEWFYLSSRLVREVARFSGDVSRMVPHCVNEALTEKYGPAKKATAKVSTES